MSKTPDTVDIIKGIVATLTPTITIDSSVDNGATFLLNISNTYWLTVNKIITINSLEYQITEFVINESITIKPLLTSTPIPAVTTFVLPAPHFFHGTVLMASNKQQVSKKANDRLPFIYLYEVLDEQVISDELNPWGRTSTPRLYFMDESSSDWQDEEHKTNAIEPMRQLSEMFYQVIIDGEDDEYGEITGRSEIARANWGRFITDKGNAAMFFADDLSGLQSSFDFVMAKYCSTTVSAKDCTLVAFVFTTAETSAGADDGTASAVTAGQNGNVTFSWTGPNGFASTDQNITGLEPGDYEVTATDDNGCISTASGTIDSAGPAPSCDLVLNSITPTHETSFGAADGSAVASVTTTAGPVNYLWSNGQTTATASNLAAGCYGFAATDTIGGACLLSGVVTINEGYAILLQSKKAVSTVFTIVYGGGNIITWTDGTDQYTGASVTFANWSTTDEKTVTVMVSDPSNITSIAALTSSKVSGTVNLSALTGYTGTLQISGNTELDELFLPVSSNAMSTLNLTNNDMLLSLDLSVFAALEGTVSVNGSAILKTLTLGNSSGVFNLMNFYSCDLDYVDFSGLTNALGANSSRIAIYSNNMNVEEVNHILVNLAALVAGEGGGGDFISRTVAIHGSNAAPNDGTGGGGGYDGDQAVLDLVAKGIGVTTS